VESLNNQQKDVQCVLDIMNIQKCVQWLLCTCGPFDDLLCFIFSSKRMAKILHDR